MDVNMLSIVLAAVAGMIVGMTWYTPKIFGAQWMKLAGVTPEMAESGKKNMMQSVGIAFFANLVSAYVIAQFAAISGATTVVDGVMLGFWLWLGLQMPINIGQVLWEQRPWKIFAINGAYWLVSAIVMATVITLMR